MANAEKVNFALIKKWEGGLSKNPDDPAAKFPVPDGSGFHTNMGITWKTFAANAKKLNYEASPKNFKEMPPDIWLKIYKNGFWDSVKADLINSQAIAEFMADWAWGSGPTPAAKNLQQYLLSQGITLKPDGKMGPITIGFLNGLIHKKGERIVFEDLDRWRRNFLKELRPFNTFGFGWFRRMDDFREYAVGIIGDVSGDATPGTVVG